MKKYKIIKCTDKSKISNIVEYDGSGIVEIGKSRYLVANIIPTRTHVIIDLTSIVAWVIPIN